MEAWSWVQGRGVRREGLAHLDPVLPPLVVSGTEPFRHQLREDESDEEIGAEEDQPRRTD